MRAAVFDRSARPRAGGTVATFARGCRGTYAEPMPTTASADPVPGLAAYADVTSSEASLRRFLHGLPGVDQVGAEARVATLGTRSIASSGPRRAHTKPHAARGPRRRDRDRLVAGPFRLDFGQTRSKKMLDSGMTTYIVADASGTSRP